MGEKKSNSTKPANPAATRVAFSPFAFGLLLVLLTLGVYWPITTHDFVDYDDGDYVFGNAQVQSGLSWVGVKWAFTTGHASNWHPLTWLSHQADVSLFGPKAGGHHLTSLLIHCANAVLLFLAMRALTGANWGSGVVAAFFALHPLHVESVAWISERKDVLSAFFGLLSLWSYANYAKASTTHSAKARAWYAWTLGAFALGLMCKPMLVTWPFVFLLLDYWPLGRVAGVGDPVSGGESVSSEQTAVTARSRIVAEKLPFFGLCFISCVVTFLVQRKGGAVSPLEGLPVAARVANSFVSYVRYLKKTIWPDDLSVLYPHPGHWPTWQVWAAVILVLAGCALAWWRRREWPHLFVGWFWFVGMLVPVIGLVQVGLQSMADRYTYLPLTGIFIAVIWTLKRVVEARHTLMRPFAAGAACLLLLCVALTYLQARVWRNSETLFGQAVRVTRDNYLAHNNLGFYYWKQARKVEAMASYRASLQINPHYADANNNLGHALAEERKYAEAIAHYRAGLRSSPENVEIHNNLGNALAETGDTDGAMQEYRFVLERKPNHADAHNNLGIALAMKGRLDEAIGHFRRALQNKPKDAGAHGNLGNAFAAQRRWEEAMAQYRDALALAPQDAQTRNNLGNVLSELGRLDEAVSNYTSALQIKTDNPEAHFNLGCALAKLHRRDEAVTHLREAVRLRPDYQAARQQLERLQQTKPGPEPGSGIAE